MPRYQLKKRCLFVDAFKPKNPENNDHDVDQRKPDGPHPIPYAHVMHVKDDSGNPNSAEYLTLNDAAGFITRFIVQRVDTDNLLPEIIASEYGISPGQAKTEIQKVIGMLEPKYITNITANPQQAYKRKHGAPGPGSPDTGGNHPGKYDLDYRVNFLGVCFFKGPL